MYQIGQTEIRLIFHNKNKFKYMFTDEQFAEISLALRDKANVISWGLGKKYTNGVDTEITSIRVYVTRKQDVDELNEIPAEIAGFPTDVSIEMPISKVMSINPDYSYGYCNVCDGQYSDFNPAICNCTQCGGNCPTPCLTNKVAQVYDNIAHANHTGRIIQGGLSGLGVNGGTPYCSSSYLCTFSLVAIDNTDDKLILLCNQHCVRPYDYLTPEHLTVLPNTYVKYTNIQNTRLNPSDTISSVDNSEYYNPSEADGCSSNTKRKIGEFKASVFLPNAFIQVDGWESQHLDNFMRLVNITYTGSSSNPIPNGVYDLAYFSTYSSPYPGLTCLQRKYINSSNDYSITIYSQPNIPTNNKVVECMYSDATIFKPLVLPPSNNSLTSTIIPLPGIHDLGEGPFEWLTREEFLEIISVTGSVYAYKSGARRGVLTDNELVKYIEGPSQGFAAIGVYAGNLLISTEYYCVGEMITFVPQGSRTVIGGGGDSGSPILLEHNGKLKVLGLFSWGGCSCAGYDGCLSNSNIGYDYQGNQCANGSCFRMVVCPIWNIAEQLNIRAWDGSVVVDSNEEEITIAGRPYLRTVPTTQPITHYKD